MPVLHPAEIWKRSGRYDIDVVFKLKDRADRDLVLAITHEEIVALHASQTIRSYRDLPQIWYHIQLKERDEPRLERRRPAHPRVHDEGLLHARPRPGRPRRGLRQARGGLRPHLHALRPRVLQGRVRHRRSWAGAWRTSTWRLRVRARTAWRAAASATTPRTSRWPSRASSRAPSPPSAPVAEVETPGVSTIEELAAVPRHRPAHDRQGDARRRRRRQGLARARARRPPPARAQAQQGAAAGHASRRRPSRSRRRSAPSRARSGRSASRRRRSAASSPTRRCAKAPG